MTKALREREGERGWLSDPSFLPLPPLGARFAEFVVDGEGKEWNAADDYDRERGEGRGGTANVVGRDDEGGRQIYFVRDEGCLST